MYISFFEIVPILKKHIEAENPQSILVVSKTPGKYVKLFHGILRQNNKPVRIDKLPIDTQETVDFEGQKIYNYDDLLDEGKLSKYDCIFMTDVIEYLAQDATQFMVGILLKYTIKSLLVVTPMLTFSQVDSNKHLSRVYHPTFFKDFDFNFFIADTIYGKMQFYNFFPQPFEVKTDKIYIEPIQEKTQKLKLGYILPHRNLTGGLKCLLEQMRQLHRRGHEVYAIYQGQKGESAIPAWSDIDLEKDLTGQILVSSMQDIDRLKEKVDILMCGFISLIPNYVKAKIPLVYWEQGYEELYGDFGQLLNSQNELRKRYFDLYHAPAHYLAVADIVSDVLHARYNVQSTLLYNGIDLNFYKPNNEKKFSGTILLVGNPGLSFKNFPFAFEVLNKVWELGGRFNVKWAGQIKPNFSGLGFPLKFYEMVSQAELAELYRTSDLFLFTSVYESFPMPPMESMASGTPVIATDCGGINTYAKAGENIMLIEQGNLNAFAEAVMFLLQNENARTTLTENGLKTARQFSFDHIVENVENYFYSLLNKNAGA